MIKIMKMAIRPILFLLVITFFTTSCSPQVIVKTDKEKTEITITDLVGREVKLTTPVRGIIGTHTPSLDTAIVLGGGGKYLIGCGYKDKTRNLYNLIMDYDKVVQIGQGKSVNLETIKTLGENIVAILPERSLDQIVLYESIGVPAVVALPNTESFETVKNSLLLVGKILGEEARAEKINAFIDRQILRAKEVSTHEPKKPSVLFLGGSSFLSVAPAAMIQSQLIEIAGGINAAQELDHKGGFANGKIKLFN